MPRARKDVPPPADRLRDLKPQLAAFIASSPVATVVIDDRQQVQLCNASFERLFGYTEAEIRAAREGFPRGDHGGGSPARGALEGGRAQRACDAPVQRMHARRGRIVGSGTIGAEYI